MPTVDVLHTPSCKSTAATLVLVERAVAEVRPDAIVRLTDVVANPDAQRRFSGSPTVLIDGVDIEPGVEFAQGAG